MEQAMTKHDDVRGEPARNPRWLTASSRVTLALALAGRRGPKRRGP